MCSEIATLLLLAHQCLGRFLGIIGQNLSVSKQGRSLGAGRCSGVENYAKMIIILFYFLRFATAMLKIPGHVIHRWKGVFKTFPMVYYKPPPPLQFLKVQLVKPKRICSRLANAEHASQRNCNGKMTAVLFCNIFVSALKESPASTYYWQCLLVMIGWLIL
jgi:hypothetical protein